jgi:hypothetical protein
VLRCPQSLRFRYLSMVQYQRFLEYIDCPPVTIVFNRCQSRNVNQLNKSSTFPFQIKVKVIGFFFNFSIYLRFHIQNTKARLHILVMYFSAFKQFPSNFFVTLTYQATLANLYRFLIFKRNLLLQVYRFFMTLELITLITY